VRVAPGISKTLDQREQRTSAGNATIPRLAQRLVEIRRGADLGLHPVAFRQLSKLAPGFHCPSVKPGRPAYSDRRKSLLAELAHLFKLGLPNGSSSRARPPAAIVLKRVLGFTGRSTIELLFYSLAQVLDEMKSIGALAGLRRALEPRFIGRSPKLSFLLVLASQPTNLFW
jgi:hypothetical protein